MRMATHSRLLQLFVFFGHVLSRCCRARACTDLRFLAHLDLFQTSDIFRCLDHFESFDLFGPFYLFGLFLLFGLFHLLRLFHRFGPFFCLEYCTYSGRQTTVFVRIISSVPIVESIRAIRINDLFGYSYLFYLFRMNWPIRPVRSTSAVQTIIFVRIIPSIRAV